LLAVVPGSPADTRLTITKEGTNVVVSWPATDANCVLESNTALTPGWTAVQTIRKTNEQWVSVTLPLNDGQRFFRLKDLAAEKDPIGVKEPNEKTPGEKSPNEKAPGEKDPSEKDLGDKDPDEKTKDYETKDPGEDKDPNEKEKEFEGHESDSPPRLADVLRPGLNNAGWNPGHSPGQNRNA
jgi:hypothetical protein